jgi:hypothetical protein
MKRVLIFFLVGISLFSCKYVEEKSFGPLKAESLIYKSLLTDSILAHNPETVKYIEFDTVSMIVKVIYDEEKGNISELENWITKLDLIAPIVEDTIAEFEKVAALKNAKADSTLLEFINKKVVTDSGKHNEVLRLDSLKKAHQRLDSLKQDSLRQKQFKLDSLRKDSL